MKGAWMLRRMVLILVAVLSAGHSQADGDPAHPPDKPEMSDRDRVISDRAKADADMKDYSLSRPWDRDAAGRRPWDPERRTK